MRISKGPYTDPTAGTEFVRGIYPQRSWWRADSILEHMLRTARRSRHGGYHKGRSDHGTVLAGPSCMGFLAAMRLSCEARRLLLDLGRIAATGGLRSRSIGSNGPGRSPKGSACRARGTRGGRGWRRVLVERGRRLAVLVFDLIVIHLGAHRDAYPRAD